MPWRLAVGRAGQRLAKEFLTLSLIVFLAISTGLSTILAVVSIIVAVQARKFRRFPTKRLGELELEVVDLHDQVASAMKLTKKINARVASRQARDAKKEIEDHPDSWAQGANESDKEWKTRIRRKIHMGERP